MTHIMFLAVLACLSCFVFSMTGMYIANQKCRAPVEGLVFGAVFGVFGIVIVSFLPSKDGDPAELKPGKYLLWGFYSALFLAVLLEIPVVFFYLA